MVVGKRSTPTPLFTAYIPGVVLYPDIYLHDTNARQAFSKTNRHLSHGCVRVERSDELTNLLLGYARFGADYLVSCALNTSPQTIPLPQAVPVIMTYNVLDIDKAGAISVYPNVYGW